MASAAPILAIASIAADMLNKKEEDARWKTANLGQIEQTRLGDLKQIVQGGHATGQYGQIGRPKESSGLGSAIQSMGSLASLASAFAGSGESGAPKTNLDESKSALIGDYDPEKDAKYKGGLSIFSGRENGAPESIDVAVSKPVDLGSFDNPIDHHDGDPDATDPELTRRLLSRIRL